MEKLRLIALFNEDEENYFKIKIDKKKSKQQLKEVIKLMEEIKLKIEKMTDIECKIKNWEELNGVHDFYKNEDYTIHIIFSEEYIHLIVRCTQEKRKEFLKLVKKYCSW